SPRGAGAGPTTRSSLDAHAARRRFTVGGAGTHQPDDLLADLSDGACRVDDRDTLGLRGRDGEEPVPNAPMEGEVILGLEAGHVARCLAGEPSLDGNIETTRQL